MTAQTANIANDWPRLLPLGLAFWVIVLKVGFQLFISLPKLPMMSGRSATRSGATCNGRSAAQIANVSARRPPDKMCPRAIGWRQHKKVSANPVAVQHFGAVQHFEGRGWGRRGALQSRQVSQTIFIFWACCLKFFCKIFRVIANRLATHYCAAMSFYSLPFTPERVEATEARLEAIYEAAKYGLKGDSLALRAGLTPAQYRRLAEFDPLVEMAEQKGRADGEWLAAKTLYDAAADGDAKAALDILKHQHGWVAKQQIDVNVDQQISVISALERAQTRVIEGIYEPVIALQAHDSHTETVDAQHDD